jgi:hypothetical protein
MSNRPVMVAIVIAFALALAFSGCSRFAPEANKAQPRERGMAYFNHQQYQEALIEFKNVIQIDPKDADGDTIAWRSRISNWAASPITGRRSASSSPGRARGFLFVSRSGSSA